MLFFVGLRLRWAGWVGPRPLHAFRAGPPANLISWDLPHGDVQCLSVARVCLWWSAHFPQFPFAVSIRLRSSMLRQIAIFGRGVSWGLSGGPGGFCNLWIDSTSDSSPLRCARIPSLTAGSIGGKRAQLSLPYTLCSCGVWRKD